MEKRSSGGAYGESGPGCMSSAFEADEMSGDGFCFRALFSCPSGATMVFRIDCLSVSIFIRIACSHFSNNDYDNM